MTSLPILSLQVTPLAQTTSIEIPDRYELKYVIPEWQTELVRRAIEPFCVLDPHSATDPSRQYAIQSLYLDTPNRDLYRISREKRARRWKARVRTYDGADKVFFEIKLKDEDMVKKLRARIPASEWITRVAAPLRPDACAAERLFVERVQRYGLVPTLMVRYRREAWVSTVDSYARVTFDRRVVCQPWDRWSLDGDPRGWVTLDSPRSMWGVPEGVVLELKCPSAVPRWLGRLPQQVGLPKTRYSKYCKGVERLYSRDTLLGVLNRT